ncbi:MAG: TerD family protein [Synergistaceae bacterium]|nr:TerD family protein [Synergistaceae bacterium]
MDIQRGFRDKLEKYLNPANIFDVDMSISGGSVYDFSCFGVDSNNKLSDDRYMIFYNQKSSPNNEIKYSSYNNGAKFSVNLSNLPESINKLVFTANIDGTGTMNEIKSHSLIINYRNEPVLI